MGTYRQLRPAFNDESNSGEYKKTTFINNISYICLNNGLSTDMAKGRENIEGQGFHTNPERINKEGRPPGKSISTILKELLQKKIPPQILKSKGFQDLGIENADKLTNAELIALMNLVAVFYKLNPTQLKAIEMIIDRTEGKPKEEITYNVTEQPFITLPKLKD